MRHELLLLYGLIIIGGALLSRWVTVFGVAIASIGLGVALGAATYGGLVSPLHALGSWALFQISYGLSIVAFDGPARHSFLKVSGLTARPGRKPKMGD